MPALRPYVHPPYKHQASNYEHRMRKLRQTLQCRALNISEKLKGLDENDPAVVQMAVNLKMDENAGKFKWIDNAIEDLAKTAAKLDPGITRDRVAELVKARNIIVEAEQAMPEGHHHVTPIQDAEGLDLYGDVYLATGIDSKTRLSMDKTDPGPTNAQVEMAARARKCVIDMVESLSKPFWPRAPPASHTLKSNYTVGEYSPKIDTTFRVDKHPPPPPKPMKIVKRKLPVFPTKADPKAKRMKPNNTSAERSAAAKPAAKAPLKATSKSPAKSPAKPVTKPASGKSKERGPETAARTEESAPPAPPRQPVAVKPKKPAGLHVNMHEEGLPHASSSAHVLPRMDASSQELIKTQPKKADAQFLKAEEDYEPLSSASTHELPRLDASSQELKAKPVSRTVAATKTKKSVTEHLNVHEEGLPHSSSSAHVLPRLDASSQEMKEKPAPSKTKSKKKADAHLNVHEECLPHASSSAHVLPRLEASSQEIAEKPAPRAASKPKKKADVHLNVHEEGLPHASSSSHLVPRLDASSQELTDKPVSKPAGKVKKPAPHDQHLAVQDDGLPHASTSAHALPRLDASSQELAAKAPARPAAKSKKPAALHPNKHEEGYPLASSSAHSFQHHEEEGEKDQEKKVQPAAAAKKPAKKRDPRQANTHNEHGHDGYPNSSSSAAHGPNLVRDEHTPVLAVSLITDDGDLSDLIPPMSSSGLTVHGAAVQLQQKPVQLAKLPKLEKSPKAARSVDTHEEHGHDGHPNSSSSAGHGPSSLYHSMHNMDRLSPDMPIPQHVKHDLNEAVQPAFDSGRLTPEKGRKAPTESSDRLPAPATVEPAAPVEPEQVPVPTSPEIAVESQAPSEPKEPLAAEPVQETTPPSSGAGAEQDPLAAVPSHEVHKEILEEIVNAGDESLPPAQIEPVSDLPGPAPDAPAPPEPVVDAAPVTDGTGAPAEAAVISPDVAAPAVPVEPTAPPPEPVAEPDFATPAHAAPADSDGQA